MTVALKNTSGGKRAGDVEYFPSGRQTYLAPLPLPTSEHPFCPTNEQVNGDRIFVFFEIPIRSDS